MDDPQELDELPRSTESNLVAESQLFQLFVRNLQLPKLNHHQHNPRSAHRTLAIRSYSLGATPKPRLNALLKAESES
jgi:hypothetical protein